MKKISLIQAKVKPGYNGAPELTVFQGEKGTTVKFQVETKINDEVERCPVVYDYCSKFLTSEEQVNWFKNNIKAGNIVNIEGRANRNSSKPKNPDEKPKYYDTVEIDKITLLTAANNPDDNLPF